MSAPPMLWRSTMPARATPESSGWCRSGRRAGADGAAGSGRRPKEILRRRFCWSRPTNSSLPQRSALSPGWRWPTRSTPSRRTALSRSRQMAAAKGAGLAATASSSNGRTTFWPTGPSSPASCLNPPCWAATVLRWRSASASMSSRIPTMFPIRPPRSRRSGPEATPKRCFLRSPTRGTRTAASGTAGAG